MADHSMDPEQLAAYIETPQKVVGDEGSVEERKATDLIALDRHLGNRNPDLKKPPFGMTIAVVRPRGTV